ncbi:cellulose binding domain-containing protein [Streptomyces sp. SCA3-4]|uniref:glycoside hydrolase family 18 protein n=1 Tax=Streptomyces sichuanensis TaxID=2871810 RepID=UPI001CE2BC8B|nr:cellulose binding domain-containing protein [Streptomyces sichuanensis]MCA6092176.1 cellulose binding domain-containing protein [Streptomyces sichuanensis]
MGSSAHRRRVSRKAKLAGVGVVVAFATGAAFTLTGTASAAPVGAAFSRTGSWAGGYTGQFVVTNGTGKALNGWTLTFELPAGTKITSLWNGKHTVSGRSVTVEPESWNAALAPGASVTVGFVAAGEGTGTGPVSCRITNGRCSLDGAPDPQPTRPTEPTRPTRTPQPGKPTPGTPRPQPTPTSPAPGGANAAFAPYVDTSLYPAYDLLATARKTGVKHFNLAFITSGGGCTPKWGGVTDLGNDAVAAQIGRLREAGGDVRVSFGGAAGSELGLACSSADELAAAYGKVVDTYKLTKVDFDIEGAALPDTAANTRRAQAIARLQTKHPGLDVSFTLPVMPTGLTQDGVGLLGNAKKNGVALSAVNVMAMDYGSSFNGDMGQYAIDAATATQAQVKGVLGLSDAAAWKAVAVTPMIGVNDVATEVFTVGDASRLAAFARSKGLGWLSMWSAARDKPCPGGPQNSASATCSSIQQDELAFTKAFATR